MFVWVDDDIFFGRTYRMKRKSDGPINDPEIVRDARKFKKQKRYCFSFLFTVFIFFSNFFLFFLFFVFL